MNQWQQTDVRVNGVRLHVYRKANGKAPLLLAHGFTDNAQYWARLAAALADDWDIIAYDVRGHGASDRAQGVFNDEQRANDLLGVLDALKIERPAAIGHSMGGSTIANAAAMRPGWFRALVLEDPAWWEIPGAMTAEQRQQAAATQRERTAGWRDWIAKLQSVSDSDALAMVRAGSPLWIESDAVLSRNARQQVELALFEHYPPPEAPWRTAIAAINCPALLLIGDERNAIITPDVAREAVALAPQTRWVQIAGAGHAIRYEQFDAYLRAVTDFLRTV